MLPELCSRHSLSSIRCRPLFEYSSSKCYKFTFCCAPVLAYTVSWPSSRAKTGVPGGVLENASKHFESRHNKEPHSNRQGSAPLKNGKVSKEPVTSVQARVQPSGSSVPKKFSAGQFDFFVP